MFLTGLTWRRPDQCVHVCFSYVFVCVFEGFKMSCMREDVLREPAIQVVDRHSTISSADTIKVCLHQWSVCISEVCLHQLWKCVSMCLVLWSAVSCIFMDMLTGFFVCRSLICARFHELSWSLKHLSLLSCNTALSVTYVSLPFTPRLGKVLMCDGIMTGAGRVYVSLDILMPCSLRMMSGPPLY
jgi:hypothetical protein